jgi:hypothetical protein
MSHLELPLLGKKVAATGDVLLRAELDLRLRTQSNRPFASIPRRK